MGERAQIQRKKAHEPASSLQHRLTNPAPGQQLDSSARIALEPRLGHSFANVRVHADGEADQLAQQVEARAFTVGQDVYFRQGTYDPASPAGLHLLAHELTHTVQQARGPVSGVPGPNGVLVSDPADSFEQAAGQAADAVFSGGTAAPAVVPAASSAVVQRDGDDDLPTQPVGPFNLGLLPGSPLGGGIGYGAPLFPVLPELEQDPRAPRPGPFVPGGAPGAPTDAGPTPRWGVGLQGRYGEDEKSIGAGFRLNF